MNFSPKTRFSGSISGMPAKSYIHRALLAAALSNTVVHVKNVVFSEDVRATIGMVKALGAAVDIEEDTVIVRPGGKTEEGIFDCGESGTSLRLGIPIAAALGMKAQFEGRGRLVERPIDEHLRIFDEQGISYQYAGGLPLTFEGSLEPGHFKVDGSKSSQYISGLLMALPLLGGDSTLEVTGVYTSKGYVDITLEVLEHFGIRIEEENSNRYGIPGNQTYTGQDITIENDYSQAAFWIVGGTLGGSLLIEGLNPESVQGDRGIIEIVNKMGGDVRFECGRLCVRRTSTEGAVIDAEQVPDLVPIVTLLASVSKGRTVIEHTERLKYKESDRGNAIATELNKLGAKVIVEEDRMVIEGVEELTGGQVDSWNDHRIAMTLAMAACVATHPVQIDGIEAVKKSYPEFVRDYRMMGGEAYE